MSTPNQVEMSGVTSAAPVLPPTAASAPPAAAGTSTAVAPAARRPTAPPPSSVPSSSAAPRSKSKKKKSSSEGAAGENTGRWTAEEHRLFLQGLEQHGKGWKKIASLIKSRTVVQIRTHAQKYFQKLAKARQNGEEGDVTMEGRGDAVESTSSVVLAGATSKRRQRLMSGTKRRHIQSVVASAQRQGKRLAAAAAEGGMPNPLPKAAPALAHFVLPSTEADGAVSASSLEDSLYVLGSNFSIAVSLHILNSYYK